MLDLDKYQFGCTTVFDTVGDPDRHVDRCSGCDVANRPVKPKRARGGKVPVGAGPGGGWPGSGGCSSGENGAWLRLSLTTPAAGATRPLGAVVAGQRR